LYPRDADAALGVSKRKMKDYLGQARSQQWGGRRTRCTGESETGSRKKNRQPNEALSKASCLVAELGEDLGTGTEGLGGLGLGLGPKLVGDLLGLVVLGGSHLALNLQLLDGGLVLPPDLVGETANGAVVAAGGESEDTEGLGADHSLGALQVLGDTLVALQSVEGVLGTVGVVTVVLGHHTTDGAEEHVRRGTVVEGTLLGVGEGSLAEGVQNLQLVAVVGAGDGGSLASDEGDLLAVLKLLGDNGADTTQKVSLHVDDGGVSLLLGDGVLTHFGGCVLTD